MKAISVAEARKNFAHVFNEVAYGGQKYTVQRHGKPLAVLVSARDYQVLIHLLSEVGVASAIHSIPVHIRFDGERFFVGDDRFNLHGEGLTLDAAREDYWQGVQAYYADLQTDAHALAPYLAAEHLAQLEPIMTAPQDSAAGAIWNE